VDSACGEVLADTLADAFDVLDRRREFQHQDDAIKGVRRSRAIAWGGLYSCG
jgi:hypothetical protein